MSSAPPAGDGSDVEPREPSAEPGPRESAGDAETGRGASSLRTLAERLGIVVWILGLFAFLAGGLGIKAVLTTFNLAVGTSATAQVSTCASQRKGMNIVGHDCSGTWRTEDGERRSGHISGVRPGDVGERVAVRVGPMGPYATPLTAYWEVYTVLPPAGWLAYLYLRRRRRRAKGRGEEEAAAG